MKIKFLGRESGTQRERDADLLLSIISNVSQSKIEITNKLKDADLVIVYPYVVSWFSYRCRWLVVKLIDRFARSFSLSSTTALRWLIGIGNAKVIFVSHENLDRPYWWMWIGSLLVKSNIPRLTFWPKEIDPKGVRFPYWYNYVDWPSYPRENLYERFGRLYQIDELMSPLKPQDNRISHAVAVGSHYDYPRAALLSSVKKKMCIDCFGGMGRRFTGSKLQLMQKYKYAFCPENSSGYGYDTEKLPEAWVAGCIPVGVYLNQYSDFNYKLINAIEDSDIVYKQPLLLKMPDLKEIEDYVRTVLQ